MFCLRSWLPLLFIPSNASPSFIFIFFVCTYSINRPCVYCSFILIVLFCTSCNWSDHCFIDFSSNWYQTRSLPGHASDTMADSMANATASCAGCHSHCLGATSTLDGLAGSLGDEIKATVSMVADIVSSAVPTAVSATGQKLAQARDELADTGFGWMRSLLGRHEWRIDCLGVYVRL